MRKYFYLLLILASVSTARAQDESSQADMEELNVIEVELERGSRQAPAAATRNDESATPADTRPIDFSGLGHLAPFTEVSVIQKRFLPKTGRFQLFAGGSLVTNDPFFNIAGGTVKAGYFFRESIGLELSYSAFGTSEAKATQELRQIQGVDTNNLIYTKSMMSADLVWVPIYGKMTWANDRIVPFDLYFSLGYGSTQTANQTPGTIHLGTGQIFAISKSTAFRWDFGWNFFDAIGIDGKKSSYNNLVLSLGFGWFFPEAKYR